MANQRFHYLLNRLLACLLASLVLSGLLFGCSRKTPQVTITPRPGWSVIQGEGVALAMPQEFIGGNPGRNLNELRAKLPALEDEAWLVLQQSAKKVALVAIHTQAIPANLNVTSQSWPGDRTLEQLKQQAIAQLDRGVKPLEQKIVPVNQQESVRLITSIGSIHQLVYLIPSGQKLWIVTASSPAIQFDRFLPIFEESVRTLQTPS